MEPEVFIDDLIIIKESEKYEENDIVTYKSNKSLITHRIVRIEGDNIYTKGDRNNTEDEPIFKEQIKGKVIKKFKGVGKIINDKTVSTLVIIFISVIFISIMLRKHNEVN